MHLNQIKKILKPLSIKKQTFKLIKRKFFFFRKNKKIPNKNL